jgi:glycosyltransferase involved in cell wall biosynthesis
MKKVPAVLHIGFARKYAASLFPAWKKKFSILTAVSENLVVYGIRDRRFMSSREPAFFYLIPRWFPKYIQYAVDSLISFFSVLYFSVRREVVVVISHNPYGALPILLGRGALRAFGKRVVVVVEAHGDWETSPFLDGFLPRSMQHFFTKAADFAFRRADVIRAVSSFTEAKVKAVSESPCITFPPYIDLDHFLEGADQAPPRDSQRILYAGVLSYRKGVHLLVQAFARLAPRHPKAALLLIGEGEYREEILRLIQASGAADRIRLIPFVNQTELKRYILSSAICVLPAFAEGLPRIMLEAMACGRPMVASEIPGVTDVVSDGWNGLLVPPGDHEALAARLEKLLNEPDLADKLGARGRDFVQERFSGEAFARGYQLLIETAMKKVSLRGGRLEPEGH